MATTRANKVPCAKCNKLKHTVKCPGCEKDFCLDDMNNHRQELGEQLGHTEDLFNQFTSDIEQHKAGQSNRSLMQQINRWEEQSINKIRQVAEGLRLEISSRLDSFTNGLQLQLKQLTDRLAECRKDNDFIDTDIHFYNEELRRLQTVLNHPSNLQVQHTKTTLVTRIHLTDNVPLPWSAYVKPSTTWAQNAITVVGHAGKGSETYQVSNPLSAFLGDDQRMDVIDTGNHRIVAWKLGETAGHVVAGGNGQGDRADQLNTPTDIIIHRETNSLFISDYGNRRVVRWPLDKGARGDIIVSNVGCWGLTSSEDGSLYLADHQQHEVRRYETRETEGKVVAGGNGSGDRFDQLDGPRYVFVDHDHSVFVSDANNHRVMRWKENATEGILICGGQGAGSGLDQLSSPNGVIVDEMGSVYVADAGNHRVMRWSSNARQGSVIVGGNGRGNQANQLSFPTGLSFDGDGNLYVVDNGNSRVQRFSIDRS